MERWTLVQRRNRGGPQFYIKNRSKTLIWLSPKSVDYDIDRVMKMLEKVGFPVRMTYGLKKISFVRLNGCFGEYMGDEIWVDTNKHRPKTVVDTIVHEVAHFLDEKHEITRKFNQKVSGERKRKGYLIHAIAGMSDDEYFARGFERFYSLNPDDRKILRKKNPKLFKIIQKLHLQYRSQSK